MPKRRSKRSRGARMLAPAQRPRALLVLVGLLLILAGGITYKLFSHASSSPNCIKIVLPAYWYPNAAWTTADDSHPPPAFLILDISGSGAGTAPDPTFQAYVKQAQAAGVTVIGYDDTTYAARPVATVETEVQHYKAWYNVTDIFFDQVSSNTGDLSYYQTIYNYVHSFNPGSTVMLNPGDYPPEAYMSVGDILMVFEDTYANYVNAQVPSWAFNYPASRFVHTIHDTSSAQWQNALTLAKSRNVGYVFITDGTGGNPYSGLPSYWSSEVAATGATCTAATPTPTPKATQTPTPKATPTPALKATPTPAPNVTTTPAPAQTVSTIPATGQPVVTGTVSVGTPTPGTIVKVDGTTVSTDGQLDTTKLTNGVHKITIQNGSTTTTRTIDVNNHLTPWQTSRNLVLSAYHAHQSQILAAIITLGLGVLAAAVTFAYRRITPHSPRNRP